MSGWQVGDLALCVRFLEPAPRPDDPSDRLQKGRIYRVENVFHYDGHIGLQLEGMSAVETDEYYAAYDAGCFRKIKPDTEGANEDDAAWLKGLLSKKVKA